MAHTGRPGGAGVVRDAESEVGGGDGGLPCQPQRTQRGVHPHRQGNTGEALLGYLIGYLEVPIRLFGV